jgi:hypothetical protein
MSRKPSKPELEQALIDIIGGMDTLSIALNCEVSADRAEELYMMTQTIMEHREADKC